MEDVAIRFWRMVERRGEDDCWPWRGGVTGSGYGSMRVGPGVVRSAHRIAVVIAGGDLPHGAFVLHSCDNKVCVNPAHLRVGSHAENMEDMAGRGRQANQYRERGQVRTLDAETRAEIADATGTLKEIGRRFGTSYETVRRIKAAAA